MLFGHPHSFAIECEIQTCISRDGIQWVLGRFRFWLGNQAVGDWDDTVSLQDCAGWIRDFIDTPEKRFEPILTHRSKEEIFHLLYDSIMDATASIPPPFERVYARFHITHLGMSAFADNVALLLIEEPHQQRVIWRVHDDTTIYEQKLPAGEIQCVGEQFYQWFQEQVGDYK